MKSAYYTFFFLVLLMIPACTHVTDINVHPVSSVDVSNEQHPLSVSLILDSSFSNYNYEIDSFLTEKDILRFGPSLTDYALQAAKASFLDVKSTSAMENDQLVDAIVKPEIIKISHSAPATNFGKFSYLISVLWTVTSYPTEQVIWVGTIDSQAEEPLGNVFTVKKHFDSLMQRLFDELLSKTIMELKNSYEIKRFSEQKISGE